MYSLLRKLLVEGHYQNSKIKKKKKKSALENKESNTDRKAKEIPKMTAETHTYRTTSPNWKRMKGSYGDVNRGEKKRKL